MEYGKLENGKLITYKPYKGGLRLNGLIIFNPTHEHFIKAGYYPVINVGENGTDYIDNNELIHYTGIVWDLDKAKQSLIEAVKEYDTSEEVNGFYLGNDLVWIPRETRVSLQNSTAILMKNGIETATLWNKNVKYVFPCNLLLLTLDAIEIYALECFNNTSEHIANISALETLEDVELYDYTTGYPEKLVFKF